MKVATNSSERPGEKFTGSWATRAPSTISRPPLRTAVPPGLQISVDQFAGITGPDPENSVAPAAGARISSPSPVSER